jgi:hypothetical protein
MFLPLPLLKLSTEIDFFVQVSAKHLLSASVMSAPAAQFQCCIKYIVLHQID